MGYGYKAYFVEGDDPADVHQQMAVTLDTAIAEIQSIQREARIHGFTERPQWLMILMRTPKGWTGPKEVDGKKLSIHYSPPSPSNFGLSSTSETQKHLRNFLTLQ